MKHPARIRNFTQNLWLILAVTSAVQATDSGPTPTLEQVLGIAAKHFERDDFDAARRHYELATRMDPGSIRAWSGLGWSLWQLGEHDQAIKLWNDVAKVSPNDPRILLALAQAHEYRENWDESLGYYNKALKQKPNHAPALMGRARIHHLHERHAQAETDLHAVIKQNPTDFEAQFMLAQIYKDTDRQAEAIHIYDQLVTRPLPSPRYLRPMADMFLELGRSEEAIDLYRKNLKHNPDNRGTVLGLARAHAQIHQYAPAISILGEYLGKHPEDAKIREELARFSDYAGDYAKAESHLRKLVAEHPEETKWWMSLAHVLLDAGKTDEAMLIGAQILKDEPDNIAAMELQLDGAIFSNNRQEVMRWLEQLSEIEPDVRRLNKLADYHIIVGDEHSKAGRSAEAKAEYQKAITIFQRSRQVDPQNADALLGLSTAQRLSGQYQEAIDTAQQALDKHPSVARARIELFQAWLALGNYDRAEKLLISTLEVYPGNMRLRHELARVRFQKGDRERAITDVKQLLSEPIKPGVPVLLYHGISEATVRDAMPQSNFRDQMRALKQQGYQSISVHELLAFYENGTPLPAKPVLITFDDARADSFRYADPVLQEFGYKATMFTPAAEVGRHGPYNAVWPTIRKAYESGRWDIQCHSYQAHETVPLDAEGTTPGNFLTNRMWLAVHNRLETKEEYTARLDADYRQCGEELVRQLPGLRLAGFAYPFGEAGQKFFSNEPDAFAINKALAIKYFKVAFLQDPAAEVTRTTGPAVLPRFEVPWNFTGDELVTHLRGINAHASTKLLMADLYSWNGQYAEANAIFEDIATSEEFDQSALMIRRANVALWQGDFIKAREHFNAAAQANPDNEEVRKGITKLDQRVRPSLTVETAFSSDNQDRSYFSMGPSWKTFLSDRTTLTTSYRHKRTSNDDFDIRQFNPLYTGGPEDLRVSGHELEARLEFYRDWRNTITLSAGIAKFSDDSSVDAFDGPGTFPLASVAWGFPAGEEADITLRASRGYVGSAGAILDDVGSTSVEGRLEYHLPNSFILDTRYLFADYDDGNNRQTGVITLFKQVRKQPEVQVGYRFRYDNTNEQNPLYYTPDKYTGHDVVVKFNFEPSDRTNFSIEASLGRGRETGGNLTQASLLGIGEYKLNDRLSFYASGGRSEAAKFSSTQINAGFSLLF